MITEQNYSSHLIICQLKPNTISTKHILSCKLENTNPYQKKKNLIFFAPSMKPYF